MSARENDASAEAALRESEYRYRNLFQAMAASFWELDFSAVGAMLRALKAQGVDDYAAHFAANPAFIRDMMRATRVLDVNDQSVALFGRGDKAELLTDVSPFWPDESAAVFAASVIAAVSRKPSYAAECKLRTIDGRLVDVLFTACFPPESFAAGKLLIGVIDISARVRAEEALRRVQAEFAHAARVSMLGEFTASIAHEVNQPLAAIAADAAAGARWLDRAEPDLAEVRALIARIGADSARAGDIIARVRAMAVRGAPEREELAIDAVIGGAARFLAAEFRAHQTALALDLAPDLPPVRADRTQLQQVIANLAMNALQAMGRAQAPRRVVVRTFRDGDFIVVSVEDNGPGIAREHEPRLFERFFTTKESGMGMGLPICRSIVEAHGGRLSAANRAEGGACFSFTLPVSSAS